MNTHRLILPTLLMVVILPFSGCNSPNKRGSIAMTEPGLDEVVGPNVASARPVTVVDRHPLFSKPRDWYEQTNSNKLVKSAAAVVIGIPAGALGEAKQIVVGSPPQTRPY